MNEASLSYHEAGHAVMAAWLGAEVLYVTIEPDKDDGPRRDGDAAIRWHHHGMNSRQLAEKELMAVLAGPVAEMIYEQETKSIRSRPAWAGDYAIARQMSQVLVANDALRHKMIDAVTQQLFSILSKDNFWQAISEVADLLEAHETIEGDQVTDCVDRWLGSE